jgi:phosphatidylglycerophosphatase A
MLRWRVQAPWRPLAWLVATGLGCGLAPVAPGTVGSLVALIIYYFLPIAGDSLALYALVGVGFLVGVAATGTLSRPSDADPRRVVWDEFVGMWATCLLLPKSLPWLAVAFLSFRVLDIWKPWPIRRLEQLPGGLGIMADDLVAGLFAAAVLNAWRLWMG